jgi:hypothetical protein
LLGAVDNPGSQRGITHLGMRAEDGYFNAGVLLIDLQQGAKPGRWIRSSDTSMLSRNEWQLMSTRRH